MPNRRGAPGRATRKNQRYGELAKLAVKISGRSPQMVYKVLRGDAVSAPVSDAIQKARQQLRRVRGNAA